jgi:DUF4097 and DUF4098 domain-containing protein YvlB
MSIRNPMLAAVLLVAAVPAAQAAQSAQQINKTVNVAADATVDVSNVQGIVQISAWDKNIVQLDAELQSSKDELTFEATERMVRIEVERPRGKYGRSDEEDANLILHVPKGAQIIVDTVSADITASGVQGEQSLQSVSGEINTQAFDAPVKATSVSGEIVISGSGGKSSVSTENVSGTSTVSGVRGGYDGEVVSGDIRATIAAAGRIEINAVSGDIDLSTELAATSRLDLESVSGTIKVRIKPPVNADFDIETFSGDIENCFGQKPRDTSKYAPGSELNFTQGSGGARVAIQSLSGEIRVCDH